MAHEITINAQGQAEAAYSRQPAWHGLGQVVENPMTAAEAMKEAHLDWEVEKRPLYFNANGGRTKLEGDLDKVVTVRTDNSVPLGIVSPKYQIVQNSDAFGFMDALVQEGEILYEAAGSLKQGRLVWMLAKMPGEFAVTDDDISQDYLLFVNGHDGSKAVTVQPTNVRVVCNNTLSWALGTKEAKRFNVRHTVNLDAKLEEARQVLLGMSDYSAEVNRINKELSTKSVDKSDLDEFIARMFPGKTVDNSENEIKLGRTAKRVVNLFEEGPLNQTQATEGTAYGLLNAVTEYIDHEKGNSSDQRFLSSQLAFGAETKRQAFATLRDMYSIS